ncbi:hypothetical protein R9C00_03405 [Flammeovirgaceae bacterium SG7u.111]|nr:hypothetical protein [Flammeovirgaceae bacterium SG7u.132]WPO36490.1 hypothetical protein R9C00_03405 [Flammeovirgaceae bacterium SG7u.111]
MPDIKNKENILAALENLPPFLKELKVIDEELKLDMFSVFEEHSFGKFPVNVVGNLDIGSSLCVFNDVGDNSREELVGEDDIISDVDQPDEVLIVPDYASQAYVQYGLGVSLEAAGSLDKIGFAFSGDASVRANTYKLHAPSDLLLKAVAEDLAPFHWVFSIDDLKELKENEACTLAFAGSLNSSIEVSWGDLYTGGLAGASQLLKTASPITIEVDAGASVQFDIDIADDFLLVIKKIADDKFEVGVKKAKRRSVGAGLSIGVSASLSPDSQVAVQKLMEGLVEKLLNRGKKEIDEALSKTNVDELADEQKETIEKVAAVLGLPSPEATLDELRLKWAELVANLYQTIEKIAKAKVEAGVRFEYSQLKTENSFLVGVLTEDALEKYHSDLLRFKVKPLLMDRSKGVKIKRFLQEKSFKRTTGFGFDLKIGEKGLSFDHEINVELLERTNEKLQKYVVSKSDKSFEGKLLGESFSWTANLHAETNGFVSDLKIGDFDYSLQLGFEWKEDKKLEKGEIKKVSKRAALWGLVPESMIDELKDKLADELKTKDAVDITVSLKMGVPKGLFKDIIEQLYRLKQENPRVYDAILGQSMLACSKAADKGKVKDLLEGKHIEKLEEAMEIMIGRAGETYSASVLKKMIKGFGKFHNNVYRMKALGYLMYYFALILKRDSEIEPFLMITYEKHGKRKEMPILRQKVTHLPS